MSIPGLQTPFQRLAALPTTMNWRGVWDVTQNYLLNDVVVDTTNNGTYILTGQIAITGGDNPISSPFWTELNGTSVGVAAVLPGAGISIDNTIPLQPEVINEGVLSISGGTNVNVDNTDPQRPIISTTAISEIVGISGIAVDNTNPNVPVISNTGVVNIIVNPGTGLLSTGGTTPTLVNTGVITIGAGAGISATQSGGTVELTNIGIAQLFAGDGILLSGLNPQEPTITNTGVLSVVAGDDTITVDDTDPQNLIITGNNPSISVLFFTPTVTTGTVPGISFILYPSTNFLYYLANGAPDAEGIFMIDLSTVSILIQGSGSVGSNNEITVAFNQIIFGQVVTYTSQIIPNVFYATTGTPYPVSMNLGLCYFNVADARAAGLTDINTITFPNTLGGGVSISSCGPVFAQYFPLGLE